MTAILVPKKNHKTLLKELCELINAYGKLKDLRNKQEIADLLIDRVPKIMNNFDKNDPLYESMQILLIDIVKNLGIIIKFVKE